MKSSSDTKIKYISGFNVIAIVVMIVAILISIFYVELLAAKVVAVAVAFMAGIALLSSIVTKKENYVEIGKFNIKSSNALIATTTTDEKATHTTIDNFDIGKENDEEAVLKFMSEEEGFMIVNNATSKTEPVVEVKEYKTNFKVNVFSNTDAVTNIEKIIVDEETNEATFKDAEKQTTSSFELNDTDKSYIASDTNSSKSEIEDVKDINNEVADSTKVIDDETKSENIIAEHNNAVYKSTAENNKQHDFIKHHTDIPIEFISDANADKKMDNSVKGFSYLIERFLFIIRSVLDAKIIAFTWVNMEDKTITLDSYFNDNDIQDAIIKNKIITLGNDILSQIVISSKPQILTQIHPAAELDLIPYYVKQTGTSSFIGVPILLDNIVVGILCADTRKSDAYDKATVMFLGHFIKIVAALLSLYSKKYENENASRTLSLINQFTTLTEHSDGSFNNICNNIIEFIITLYKGCSSVGVVTFTDDRTQLNIISYKSIENVSEQFLKLPISLKSSLLGNSISNSKIIAIPTVPQEYIRVNNAEPQTQNISFISVPIKSTSNTYGALFIESSVNNFIDNVDFQLITAICNQAGEFTEKLKIVTLFNNYATIDINTGIITESAFRNRLNEELQRANNTNSSIVLALIAVDNSQSINKEQKKKIIIDNLIKNISKQIETYEIFGKVTYGIFGIIFIGRNSQEVKLLLERIRQHIATQFLNIDNEKIISTVSIGIVASQKSDTFEKLTTNATSALRQAQKRTNCVFLFE